MNDEWQWNGSEWQPPSGPGSYDQGLGNYPTQASSGSDGQGSVWDPVPPPPPPPEPPYFSSYGQTGNASVPPPGGSYPFGPGMQPSRSRPWFLIPLAIMVLLCAGGIGISVYAYNLITSNVGTETHTGPSATTSAATATAVAGPLTIPVGAHPTIVIDRNAGAVQIQGVTDSQNVVIKPVDSNAPLADGEILFSKDSDNS